MSQMSREMREFEDIDGLRDEAARTKVRYSNRLGGAGKNPFAIISFGPELRALILACSALARVVR